MPAFITSICPALPKELGVSDIAIKVLAPDPAVVQTKSPLLFKASTCPFVPREGDNFAAVTALFEILEVPTALSVARDPASVICDITCV